MTCEIEKTPADFKFKGWPDPDLPRHLDGEKPKQPNRKTCESTCRGTRITWSLP